MQLIFTKFLPPTNTKGPRIKAYRRGDVSVTVAFNYEADQRDNHLSAARALMKKIGWRGALELAGGTPDFLGYCVIFTETKGA